MNDNPYYTITQLKKELEEVKIDRMMLRLGLLSSMITNLVLLFALLSKG